MHWHTVIHVNCVGLYLARIGVGNGGGVSAPLAKYLPTLLVPHVPSTKKFPIELEFQLETS